MQDHFNKAVKKLDFSSSRRILIRLFFFNLVGTLLLLSACQVEPVCLNCEEEKQTDTTTHAMGGAGGEPASPKTPSDQGQGGQIVITPTCQPTNEFDVFCNQRDDDCDGITDEEESEHQNRLQNDPLNCGLCARSCLIPNAIATCQNGACTIHQCGRGFHNLDLNTNNGCEYECLTENLTAICEQVPTSCHTIDEGIELCDGQYETQNGQIQTITNGVDNDCDGKTDEGFDESRLLSDIYNCGGCRNNCLVQMSHLAANHSPENPAVACDQGSCVALRCDIGFETINPQTGQSSPLCECTISDEVCDGRKLDDDCDGIIDENPVNIGECGTIPETCSLTQELCTCRIGNQVCTENGKRECKGFQGPEPEQCDGFDNDCDGKVDEIFLDQNGQLSSLQHCGSCHEPCIGQGNLVAECVENIEAMHEDPEERQTHVCQIRCPEGFHNISENDPEGSPIPCEYACIRSAACAEDNCVDACDGRDDDCDGQTDEDAPLQLEEFDTQNCLKEGVCERRDPACRNGRLDCGYPGEALNSAEPFYKPDNNCDNADNDCNGIVDDLFLEKGNDCTSSKIIDGIRYIGECTRHGQWVCNEQHQGLVCGQLDEGQEPSAFEICDSKDNNCNGEIDENVGINLGNTPEEIRQNSRNRGIELVGPLTTELAGERHTYYVMAFEASLPNATGQHQGTSQQAQNNLVCSKPEILPHTQSVTWKKAQLACCALNESNSDEYSACMNNESGQDPSGWHLCKQEELQNACQGPAVIRAGAEEESVCLWSYTEETEGNERAVRCDCDDSENIADCTEQYERTRCADAYFDCDPITQGKQNCTAHPVPTQSFAQCHMNWGEQGQVFDLTGNAAEWTSTLAKRVTIRVQNQNDAPTIYHVDEYKIVGGSHLLTAGGLRCDADFRVGTSVTALPENLAPEDLPLENEIQDVESPPEDFHFTTDTGYRCCYTP